MYLEDQRDAVLSSLYSFYCQVTLHVWGVSRTHHQEYTSCSYNHWRKSKFGECSDKIRLKRANGRAATSLWTGPKIRLKRTHGRAATSLWTGPKIRFKRAHGRAATSLWTEPKIRLKRAHGRAATSLWTGPKIRFKRPHGRAATKLWTGPMALSKVR